MAEPITTGNSPLQRLPSELIREITKHLCSHCSDCDSKASRLALQSLSLTSSKIRDVAQPILCHEVFLFQSQWHFNKTQDARYFDRLVMLASTPRLATAVRSLRINFCTEDTRERRMVVLAIAKTLSFEIPKGFVAGGPDKPLRSSAGRPFFDVMTQALICQVRNIQNLDIVMNANGLSGEDESPTSTLDYVARYFASTIQGPGFAKLQSATFTAYDEDETFKFTSPGIKVIMDAAPNLNTLQFHGVDYSDLQVKDFQEQASTLAKIRNLQFWDADFSDASSIYNFVKHTPQLDSLSIHTMRTSPISISNLLPNLGAANKTIRHFSFEHKFGNYQEPWSVTKEALACLPNLKTLRIGQPQFCAHDDANADYEIEEEAQLSCLLDILPTSIESLVIVIDDDHDCCNCAPDFQNLVDAVKADKYPNLHLVQIDLSNQATQPTSPRRVLQSTVHQDMLQKANLAEAITALLQSSISVWARDVNTWFPYDWKIGTSQIYTVV